MSPWTLLLALAIGGLGAVGPGAARASGPGCHPETPAIAHRADAAVLDPQPAGGPIPCRNYTGFAGGESRIEVNDHGTVSSRRLSVYYCYMFSGDGLCSKSLDGGATFSFTGFEHRSSVPLPVNPECGGAGDTDERSGSMAAACDGSLYTPVWGDEGNFLSSSSDEGASWSVFARLPSDWDLGSDRAAGILQIVARATST